MAVKPAMDEFADFWTRKKCYAVNPMVVCDDEKRITYIELGWVGSAHDQRVFDNSDVSTDYARTPPTSNLMAI